jgi:hypothetical protein
MEALAASQGLGDVVMLKVIGTRAIISDFDPLLDDIFAAHPDVIFLDSSLVIEARRWGGRLTLWLNYLRWLRAGREPWRTDGRDPVAVQKFDPPCNPNWQMDEGNLAWWKRERKDRFTYRSTGPAADSARAFVARAEREGTRLVIIEIPLNEVLEQSRSRREDPHAKTLLRELTSGRNVSYREFEGGLTAADYCDPVHLDLSGRQRYSVWVTWLLAMELTQ